MAQIGTPSTPETGKQLSKVVAIFLLLVLAASYVINAMDRQVFPVLVPSIDKVFHFTLPQGGLLATIFTLGVGLSGIPAGYLLDKMSRKSVIIVGMAIYSLFTLLTVLSVGFGDMLLYRFGSGVGEGLQNAALYSAIGAYFYTYRAMALGTMSFAYGIGGFLGPNIGAALLVAKGWKAPMVAFGLLGFAFLIFLGFVVPRIFTEKKEIASTAITANVDHVPTNVWNRNILVGTAVGVIVGLVEYGYIGLYATFLIKHLAFNPKSTALAFSMFGLGGLVAGIPAGYLGDRFRQKWIIIIGFVCSALVSYILFNVVHSVSAQMVFSFFEGAFTASWLYVNGYSLMQRCVRPEFVGRASGIYVTAAYLPAAMAGWLFGKLVGGLGWGGAELIQLTLLPLIGIVVVLFLNESTLVNARRKA